MSNTVKIGTIFLACLLNLFQAAALKESIPSTNPRLEKSNGIILLLYLI